MMQAAMQKMARLITLRPLQLLRKPTEPRRQEHELIDLVRGDGGWGSVRRGQNGLDRVAPLAAFGRRAWEGGLGADAAAADHVGACVALVAGDRVYERERLDGKAEAAELLAEVHQALGLVGGGRGALEGEAGAGVVHFAPERGDGAVVAALEEGGGQGDLRGVLGDGASADAGAEALVHLVADAAGRARGQWRGIEELDLVAEVHARVERAVAEAQGIGQLAERIGQAVRAEEGTVV